jgi:hypothetical protein
MDALVGGEVQGKVSAVAGLLALRAKPHNAGGENLTDLSNPLGGGHAVGVEGVVHRRDLLRRDDAEDMREERRNTIMSIC